MFHSILKTAVFCGLFATVAMFTSSANAQSGSRNAIPSAVQSFTPAQSVVPAVGSGSRSFAPVQSYAPTQTYQQAAPMPLAQSYAQPVTQSYAQPINSGCSSCGGGVSPSFAPVYQAPVLSRPIYTPSNYNPAAVYRPMRYRGGYGGCGGY